MTRVKICGLTRETDLEAAVDAGADAIGIVSDVPIDTPREVAPERAADLVAAAPPFVTTVLVTMPTGPKRAIELVERIDPDAIQIHGGMRPGDLAYLRAKVDAQVFLAVDAERVTAASRYDDLADALVVDSADEQGAGGTGETHDWERTRAATADLESPVILAGGLTPDNVEDAIRTVSPYAVDVSSGIEARLGVKDLDAVRSFVERGRRTTTSDSRPRVVEP
ncbi:phosphoribosylanthranilate isomerase [Natronosalvus halobius]|uniref:phosphoribosylanthranilate isomerase n=1 Tax=Natronosalvus halobius TaxID=2953746 RepID=UPI0020A0A69C|nr:phosphoribosylanthranilate isomerase [Natronosalvus halobius]USZ72501.1 phosphoribosylanthranilate isomerase [Natronosalvus halobius]